MDELLSVGGAGVAVAAAQEDSINPSPQPALGRQVSFSTESSVRSPYTRPLSRQDEAMSA